MAYLVFPTVAVRESYLAGEREASLAAGFDAGWLDRAAAGFDEFVARRALPTRRWDVPVTELWYVDDRTYVGTVVIRRELTPALARVGGHIGYHVVPPLRRRGHGRRMLADALVFCAHFGLERVLVTCEQTNVASRKVIEANGGKPDGMVAGELRFWIGTGVAT